jgi:hypothetical protein
MRVANHMTCAKQIRTLEEIGNIHREISTISIELTTTYSAGTLSAFDRDCNIISIGCSTSKFVFPIS